MVGDGKVALDCLKILHSRPAAELVRVYCHPDQQGADRTRGFCEREGIPFRFVDNVNDAPVLDELEDLAPHLFFTIGSPDILRAPLLEIPREAVVNFHNGPLPDLRGVNVPSWAIWLGATEHAVTWHLVEEGIDTGSTLAERRFPIRAEETAISLIFTCVREGVDLFDEMIDDLLTGEIHATPQVGPSNYFSRKDVPNEGVLEFSWRLEKADRLVRALDFRPFENPLSYPKVVTEEGIFAAHRLEPWQEWEGGAPPGTFLGSAEEGIYVAFADGAALLKNLTDLEGQVLEGPEVAERFSLVRGSPLGQGEG